MGVFRRIFMALVNALPGKSSTDKSSGVVPDRKSEATTAKTKTQRHLSDVGAQEKGAHVDVAQSSITTVADPSIGKSSNGEVETETAKKKPIFALLIGINTYNSGQKSALSPEANVATVRDGTSQSPAITNLQGAVPDAQIFEKYLLDTLKVDKNNISTLLEEGATRQGIINAFRSIAENENIKKDDTILIYYAGHGSRALPPTRMTTKPACPKQVELLLPYDFSFGSTDYQHMGIPDYTFTALLNKISTAKGNNITLVFDCCHSASIARGQPGSQEIVRAFPGLDDWRVPDDLDKEIWQPDETQAVNTRGSPTVPLALRNTGTSSYVLFSACKSSETAKEASKRGYFTKALIDLLTGLGPNPDKIMCSQIISRLQKEIPEDLQSPQCEGYYSQSRPFFQGYTSPYAGRYFDFQTPQKGGVLTLNGGEVHGFCKDDELLVYESRLKDPQEKPITTVVITQVRSDTSILKLKLDHPLFSLDEYPNAAAILSKKGTQYLKVYFDQKESSLRKRINDLGLCIIEPTRNDAHIAISPHFAEKTNQLLIEIVNKDLLKLKDVDDYPKPRLIDDTDEDLAHVIKGLSHYYHHLERTNASLKDSIDKISVSFFEVLDAGSGNPRVDKLKDAKNLCRDNVIDIDVTANPDAIYGFEITNNTDEGKILHPVLLYFDNTEFTISQSYPHIVAGERTEALPWPEKGHSLTIGYGVGAGSNVHPFGFYVGDDYKMETGFFKLFLFEKSVNLQSILQTESVFTKSRGMTVKTISSGQHSNDCWGSITMNVIQRKGKSLA